MITQIKFQNFKALKNAEIKLGAFNVIVGPNGSGKSSVLQIFRALTEPHSISWELAASVGKLPQTVLIEVQLKRKNRVDNLRLGLHPQFGWNVTDSVGRALVQGGPDTQELLIALRSLKVFSFGTLGNPVPAQKIGELLADGSNLVGALTNLRDKDEDAYDRLKTEFLRWVPEYDSLIFENDSGGMRHLKLRQKSTKLTISASQVSEGTLLSLALLTIVYQPTAPLLVGLEEPDRGLHPRLLQELRDALYRLSFPSDFGITRNPVQVVITTHSPFFLDLLKDHPEQVIIAEKQIDGTATFKNLSDDPDLRQLIGDAPLGEVWYSGVLGGVPLKA